MGGSGIPYPHTPPPFSLLNGSDDVYLPLAASGTVEPISLLEILTVSGNIYLFSEGNVGDMPSILKGGSTNAYKGWVTGQPTFQTFGSTQTDTGSISLQNISGNTVQRDAALLVSQYELIGAFVYYRLWNIAGEQSLFTFMGSITGVEVDETQMDLSLEGFDNYSMIRCLDDIGVSCPLTFASPQCASTSPTPCQQSYGTCTSIERFKGVIIQWSTDNQSPPTVQVAQPAPAVSYNSARAF